MAEITKLLIGGREYESSQPPLSVIYPWNQQTQVGACYTLDFTQMNGVIQKAQQGFEAFRESRLEERISILKQLAVLMTNEQETMAKLITLECGKPLDLAKVEVTRAISVVTGYAQLLASEGTTSFWQTVGQHKACIKRVPHGPVLAITPFNFPVNLVVHKLAPAIAAGTSMTLKPSSKTPLSALFLGMLAVLAGYNHLTVIPCSPALAESFIQSGVFRKISFTGSPEVGWHLKSLAPKAHWTLELGSNSACMVDDVELGLDEIAGRVVRSAFQFAGQSCISLQRLYVTRHLMEPLLERLSVAAQALRLDNPMHVGVDLGSVIDPAQCQRIHQWVEAAKTQGARAIVGGTSINEVTYPPTIMLNVPSSMPLISHEVFGPVMCVIPYDTFSEGLYHINESMYGLHASVFTANPTKIQLAYDALEVGGVIHNDIPSLRLDELPYGGVKESGMGREGVQSGLLEMTYPRTLIQSITS